MHAQTVLQLSYPASAPGGVPCLYTTNPAGISADPQTGHLLATGDFTTGCPQTGAALPLPVIVPGPSDWQLPNPWAVNQATAVQWAAANAASCTYGGSSASGWPSGTTACGSTATCQTLHNVSLTPLTSGQYQFSLTCNNATGGITSTSEIRNVAVNPPVITQGPADWNVIPWQSGQTRSVQWSANNADNCNFIANTLPSGVALGDFLSQGVKTCTNQNSCALSNNLILNATVPGTYSLTLTCTRTSGGSATSSANWNVTQSSSGSCLHPASAWNRLETAEIYNGAVGNIVGTYDATQFESIWGRDYAAGGTPTRAWPGVSNQLVMPRMGFGQYIAAKFRTPAAGPGGSYKTDGTSYQLSGGGSGNQAKVSMTVSTVCGDFDTGSSNIPPNCTSNQMGGGETFSMFVTNSGPSCRLQPNTDYYFNVIYAPLTSPATAVFNGFGIYDVTLLQGLNFVYQ